MKPEAYPIWALGVLFAANRIDRTSTGAIGELQARASALRSLLLTSADALAQAGVLSMRDIDKIRAGRGWIDAATDCIELAALFRNNAAALRGKTAVTAAQVMESARVGTELLGRLKPKGTPKTSNGLKAEVDLRDRFWTLLVNRYEVLRRAGGWLFGMDHMDENVPAIQSRQRTKTKKAPLAPAPAASN